MWFEGRGYTESFQDLIDIHWHENIDVLKLVILFEGESTLECTSEVACFCVFGLECVVQVIHIDTSGVLDTKIINDEDE